MGAFVEIVGFLYLRYMFVACVNFDHLGVFSFSAFNALATRSVSLIAIPRQRTVGVGS